MSLQFIPLQPDHQPQAALLLAQRHQRDRLMFPELAARLADPAEAQKAIGAALARKQATGIAALDGERLVAYIIGDAVIDSLAGRSAWVRTAGYAYDPAVGVEVMRDLYAQLGTRWVRAGIFSHFALVLLSDPALVQAWFSLSFGIEQIHALLDLHAFTPTPLPVKPDLVLRQATGADREHLATMSDVIWRQQVQAPVWAIQPPESINENRNAWASQVDETEVVAWLAFLNGQVVGSQGYWPPDVVADDVTIPDQSIYMSMAATRAAARGQGIGQRLTQYGLTQAQAKGYRYCITNWRSANLLASRFWPRQGFRPLVYRLVRRIDQRIAWADGEAAGM